MKPQKPFKYKLSKKEFVPFRYVYLLYDAEGDDAGCYRTYQECVDDAWGPRFKTYTIRQYRLVPKKEEK